LKYLFAVAIALGLAFVAYGAAATISLNGGTIQVGEDDLVTCDDAIAVAGWGLETDDGLIHFVRIGDISSDCFGNALIVHLTDSAGDPITGATGSVDPIDAATEIVNLDTPPDAAEVFDIKVWIEGPGGTADD